LTGKMIKLKVCGTEIYARPDYGGEEMKICSKEAFHQTLKAIDNCCHKYIGAPTTEGGPGRPVKKACEEFLNSSSQFGKNKTSEADGG